MKNIKIKILMLGLLCAAGTPKSFSSSLTPAEEALIAVAVAAVGGAGYLIYAKYNDTYKSLADFQTAATEYADNQVVLEINMESPGNIFSASMTTTELQLAQPNLWANSMESFISSNIAQASGYEGFPDFVTSWKGNLGANATLNDALNAIQTALQSGSAPGMMGKWNPASGSQYKDTLDFMIQTGITSPADIVNLNQYMNSNGLGSLPDAYDPNAPELPPVMPPVAPINIGTYTPEQLRAGTAYQQALEQYKAISVDQVKQLLEMSQNGITNTQSRINALNANDSDYETELQALQAQEFKFSQEVQAAEDVVNDYVPVE